MLSPKNAIALAKAQANEIRNSAQTTGVMATPAAQAEYNRINQVAYDDQLWECPNCGVLTREEVKQVERYECCMEACRYCDRDADPVQYDKTRRAS